MFKAGGCKSYRNYQSRAKDAHIAAGFEVSPQLDRMLRLCRQAVIRGLAGPVRSEAFCLERVCSALEGVTEAISIGGPVFPLAIVVTAVFFLLRELEAASATWDDVVMSDDAKTITLTLPSSKTDWAAKGCRSTWGCVCLQGRPCVCHTMMGYRKWTLQRQDLVSRAT